VGIVRTAAGLKGAIASFDRISEAIGPRAPGDLPTPIANAALIASAAFAQGTAPFKEYKVPDSPYTVSFPGDPSVGEANHITTKDGVSVVSRGYSVVDNGTTYVLLRGTYPANQENSDLTDLLPGEAKGCGGTAKLEHGKYNYANGKPAIFFDVDCPATEKRPYHMLIGVVAVANGNDILQLMVAWTEASGANDDATAAALMKRADAFWSSLKID
jgi:hypothetical protein